MKTASRFSLLVTMFVSLGAIGFNNSHDSDGSVDNREFEKLSPIVQKFYDLAYEKMDDLEERDSEFCDQAKKEVKNEITESRASNPTIDDSEIIEKIFWSCDECAESNDFMEFLDREVVKGNNPEIPDEKVVAYGKCLYKIYEALGLLNDNSQD